MFNNLKSTTPANASGNQIINEPPGTFTTATQNVGWYDVKIPIGGRINITINDSFCGRNL